MRLQEADFGRYWPWPSLEADKYARGVVGIDTGSRRYPGAAVLTVLGALYTGAGFIRFCGTDAAHSAVLQRAPSITFGVGQVNVWLVGSGWDDTEANQERLDRVIADDLPLVVDATALQVMPSRLPAGSLLTPHAGELAQMMSVSRSEVEADPVGIAEAAAKRWQASVLIKGHHQYVVDPAGEVKQALVGPAWTAQAGSGDVLAGIASSLMAQGCEASMAGCLAASIQALAASRHPGPYPPDVLAGFLPQIIASFILGTSPIAVTS